MDRDRGEGGKFASKVTNSDVLQALRGHGDPVATAAELGDVLGVTPETTRRHLSELREEGHVERKEVGARAVVWWTTTGNEYPNAPAAPLRQLVAGLDEEAAEDARERSAAWRDKFDEELTPDGA